MSSVSRCDTCGEVFEHADGMFVKIMSEKPTGSVNRMLCTWELCPHCFAKMINLLKIDDAKLSNN